MNMKVNLLFLYTESPLHIGAGASIAAVDLPIQRERTTQHPVVPGSSLKGVLRSQSADGDDKERKTIVFGPDPEEQKAHEHAGAITVGDAHVVLFPVRALSGVFAYVTCPLALARLARDLRLVGLTPNWKVPTVQKDQALVTARSAVTVNGKVVLEEFTFMAQPSDDANAIAAWLAGNALPNGAEYDFWRQKVQSSLVILPDDDFRDFVLNSTEISTHVRLDPNTKTVAPRALWTEEALPSDVLLCSLIIARRSRRAGNDLDAKGVSDSLRAALPARLQLGGNETTGQGLVVSRWVEGA
ncbi:MAG: type III-B CRISPR module RAMP protein Cmr4 [Anaerolineae bacterium]